MLTRRHFQLIADIIADLSLSNVEHDDLGLIELDALRQSIARQFADGLTGTNPGFSAMNFWQPASQSEAYKNSGWGGSAESPVIAASPTA